MAEQVVDLLEAVEVEEKDCDAVSSDGVEGVLDAVPEERSIRKRRQRVMEGRVDELVLEHLALADVTCVEHDPAHARVLEQVCDRHLGLADVTRCIADAQVENAGPVGLGGDLSHDAIELPGALLVEQHLDRIPEDGVDREAEDALDRLGLVEDAAAQVDHGDDVRGMLHERLEPLLTRVELDQPLLEMARQRSVLGQRQDLPHHDRRDDEGAAPVDDAVRLPGSDDLDRARGQCETDGHVREQEPERPRVLRLELAFRDVGRRSQAGQHDRHEADEPADVDDAPGAVVAGGAQVGEAAVRHGERAEAEHDRPHREDLPSALAAAEEHVERDRDQHHVAERIGEADHRRGDPVAAGGVDLVEHEDPAAEEHRAGDHHPVDDGSDASGMALRCAWKRKKTDSGEKRQPEVADVSVRRKRHLSAGGLVPRPDHVPEAPRDRCAREEDPGAPVRASSASGHEATRGRGEGSDDAPDVRDRARGGFSADVKHEQGSPGRGYRGSSPTCEEIPVVVGPRTTPHTPRYRPNSSKRVTPYRGIPRKG